MSGPYWGPVDFPGHPGGHQALPVRGSYRSERTGQPAVLTDDGAYPVTAECKTCHGRIRLDHLIQTDWRHAPAGEPS
jgi:hypothetical protein